MRMRVFGAAIFFVAGCLPGLVLAQVGTLAEPFPAPTSNAALNYQRALLLMSALDDEDRELLKKDVWEVVTNGKPAKGQASRIKRMLYRGRHAVELAGKAARLQICDFGIDFADTGGGTLLPHAAPMVELGRLLVLRGVYAQSQGNWNEAAVIYFDALRIGRHLTHQPTLIEALAGMSIQENAFYALAHWASTCPKTDSVARAFGMFEIMADDLIDPARTLACETAILAMDFEYLERAFPDGPWGSAILTALDKEPGEDEKENRKAAVAACIAAGAPKSAFESGAAVRKYIASLKELDLRFAEAAAACMKLPAQPRIKRGQRLYDRYQKAAGAIGKQTLLNPAEIGTLFASHEAKYTVLRVALAVAAKKTDQGFPASLQNVAGGFGGAVPVSPYDGTELKYETSANGKSFRVSLGEVRVAGIVLPQVDFGTAPEPVK